MITKENMKIIGNKEHDIGFKLGQKPQKGESPEKISSYRIRSK